MDLTREERSVIYEMWAQEHLAAMEDAASTWLLELALAYATWLAAKDAQVTYSTFDDFGFSGEECARYGFSSRNEVWNAVSDLVRMARDCSRLRGQ